MLRTILHRVSGPLAPSLMQLYTKHAHARKHGRMHGRTHERTRTNVHTNTRTNAQTDTRTLDYLSIIPRTQLHFI